MLKPARFLQAKAEAEVAKKDEGMSTTVIIIIIADIVIFICLAFLIYKCYQKFYNKTNQVGPTDQIPKPPANDDGPKVISMKMDDEGAATDRQVLMGSSGTEPTTKEATVQRKYNREEDNHMRQIIPEEQNPLRVQTVTADEGKEEDDLNLRSTFEKTDQVVKGAMN